MQIKMMQLDKIRPYDDNPRDNAEAVAEVRKSIRRFGVQQPIVLDPLDDTIIVGHTRWQAAIEEGLTEYPCKYADKLSRAEIKAYRLMDNKTAEFAKWKQNVLKKELNEIQTLDSDLTPEYLGFEVSTSDTIDDAPPAVDETSQFIVAVHCRNEEEMQAIFEEMQERKIPCNLIT